MVKQMTLIFRINTIAMKDVGGTMQTSSVPTEKGKQMTDRERLIKLLSVSTCQNEICNFCGHFKNSYGCEMHKREQVVDHLLANGVTFSSGNEYMFTTTKESLERLPGADADRITKAKENTARYTKGE